MRKVIATEFLALNGVMEAPEKWSFPFFSEDVGAFKHEELFATGALLLGRVTYQGFAAAWPSRTDEAGFADRINSLPKYVVSTTLNEAEWNNSSLIKGTVVEEIAQLKQQPGQDILIHGSAELVNSLMPHDLIDEYRLLVYPVVVATGKHLFQEGGETKALKLVDSKTFESGAVMLTYEPDQTD